MPSPPEPQTIYLDPDGEAVCVIVHGPAPQLARDTAVILCPPFGFDEVCSYRPRREWACRLAAAGYAAVRLSYPSTGDSGGDPDDPGRLDAWVNSITASAAWLRAATGARRIVAIGLELGGLLAYRAISDGAMVDDLVLWATPARGRALIRQLKAFSALEHSEFFEGLDSPPPLAEGALHVGGFFLSAETVADLEAINLAQLALPAAPERRVLLLERDGIAVDVALRERLENLGAAVAVGPGDGYGAMTAHPQTALAPGKIIDQVMAWLGEASAPRQDSGAMDPFVEGASAVAKLSVGDTEVQETSLAIERPEGKLSAILSEPCAQREPSVCAVLLNAGAVRRAGPNRMWVETARRWAARGLRVVRLDVAGIGDADGETTPYPKDGSLYSPALVAQVGAALDALRERDIGETFVLVGLCAGAYWSLQLALEEPYVRAALMVNPRQLFWDPDRAPARDFRALLTEFSFASLRKNATRKRVKALLRWLLTTPMRALRRLFTGQAPADSVERVLDLLQSSGKRALFLFSEHEPLQRELTRSGALSRIAEWDHVTAGYVPVRDHTLRPFHSQRQASEILDRTLELELREQLQPASPQRPPC